MQAERAAVTEHELLADGAYHEAMQRAGHLLSSRARSEHEIRFRLFKSGFDDATVERTVARLIELRLVDDEAFCRQWIEERVEKGRAPDALIAELEAKGVDRSVAEAVLAEVAPDEEAQASDVAQRLFRKVAGKPLAQQAQALLTMLLRRGFSHEAAGAGVRAVMPPEGWD